MATKAQLEMNVRRAAAEAIAKIDQSLHPEVQSAVAASIQVAASQSLDYLKGVKNAI
jgi:uncharacterized protein (UPF0147 family)